MKKAHHGGAIIGWLWRGENDWRKQSISGVNSPSAKPAWLLALHHGNENNQAYLQYTAGAKPESKP